MIPSVVARQVRETVLDYLRTTFALADSEFECALFDFLDGEEGLFKGPYLDIRLPFRKAGRRRADPSRDPPRIRSPTNTNSSPSRDSTQRTDTSRSTRW